MGRIFMVRHGQASFLARDYDKLSPIGEAQARLLGEYWARHHTAFDQICSGPRLRQKDTARIACEACRNAGHALPDPVVADEFDEYQGDAVLEQSLPRLLACDAEIRELHRALQGAQDPAEQRKSFQRLFETVIGRWVNGEVTLPDVESWPAFCNRVNRGLSTILSARGRGQQVAIFSSAGPVAAAMQRALNLSPQDTLRSAWMVRNCSYTEFLCSSERFTLSTFNACPHLEDAAMLTYR